MAEETRRSTRATRGQHSQAFEPPPPKPAKRGAKKQKKEEVEEEEEGSDEDALIRCICGATTEDDDDERMMICCDKCASWQHNECMEVTTDVNAIPATYLCEQCDPVSHKVLLDKVARGEKPWEERTKKKEEEAQHKKRGRKSGDGKKGRPSNAKSEASANGAGSPVEENTTIDPALEDDSKERGITGRGSMKRKAGDDAAASPAGPQGKSRKMSISSTPKQENVAGGRRVSSNGKPEPRRASNTQPSPPLQLKLVSSIEELQNENRSRTAKYFKTSFISLTQAAVKAGAFEIPPDQTVDSVATRFALQLEHSIFVRYHNADGSFSQVYKERLGSIPPNLKVNHELRDQVLRGEVALDRLAQMSSEDMASSKLKDEIALIRKESEKQHILVQEEGPRIRRTHKGEELVENEQEGATAHNEVAFVAPPARRRESVSGREGSGAMSPEAISQASPTSVEFNDNGGRDWPVPEGRTGSTPLRIDTQSSPKPGQSDRKSSATFRMEDVWSSVRPADASKRASNETPSRQFSSITMANPGHDPDIDQLLEGDNESPPYSPTDHMSDPSTVWHGKLTMANVAQIEATAKHVAGADISNRMPWKELMPRDLTIEGRIQIARANEYLCSLRFSQTTDVIVVGLHPTDSRGEDQFTRIWEYFHGKQRYGVLKKPPGTESVRDVYIIPVESGTDQLPDFMNLLEHNTLLSERPERMLLVSFVVRAAGAPPSASANATTTPTVGQGSPSVPAGSPYTGLTPGAKPPTPWSQPAHQGTPPSTHGPTHPPPQPTAAKDGSHILGPFVAAPSLTGLPLEQLNDGQLKLIRKIFEQVPESQRNDRLLTELLAKETQ